MVDINIDRFSINNLHVNYKFLICGRVASGKTYLTKKIIENQINKKDNIYIFQPPQFNCYFDLSQYNNIHIVKENINSKLLQEYIINNNYTNEILFVSDSCLINLSSQEFDNYDTSFIFTCIFPNHNNMKNIKSNIDYIFLFNYNKYIYTTYLSNYMNINDFKNLFNNNEYYKCLVIDVKSNNINNKLLWYKV